MQTMIGGASYYDLPGNLMANGQKFDAAAMNAAMLQTKLGTVVTVSLVSNPTKSIKVTVTDRGPYAKGRIIDLTPAAFIKLCGSTAAGVAHVKIVIP